MKTVQIKLRPAREERRRDVVHNTDPAPYPPVPARQHLAYLTNAVEPAGAHDEGVTA